jgi:hypothetical protein
LCRLDATDDFKKLRERVPFDVELDAGKVLQVSGKVVNVGGSNVSLIRSRMNRDTLYADGYAKFCGPQYARDSIVPRIPEQGDFVKVYAKSGHGLSS